MFGDNIVVLLPFNSVSQGFRIFSQQILPVTRDILHPQVVCDELAPSEDKQKYQTRVNS